MRQLASHFGIEEDEDRYNAAQSKFVDKTIQAISVAIQVGNANAIISRSRGDRYASGKSVPPVSANIADWALGAY